MIVGLSLVMVLAWTTWWHLGDLSGDGSLRDLFTHTTGFLSWTFLPCWAIAGLTVGLIWRWTGRPSWRQPAIPRAAATLVAPAVWSVGFCLYYHQLYYLPTATLVAEAAWIVTLQPLWAYLVLFRLDRRNESST